MKAYIGWVIELSTEDVVFNRVHQTIAANDKDEAVAKLVDKAKNNIAYDPLDHHPIVLEIDRIPETLGEQ